jgi:hypothetical protein
MVELADGQLVNRKRASLKSLANDRLIGPRACRNMHTSARRPAKAADRNNFLDNEAHAVQKRLAQPLNFDRREEMNLSDVHVQYEVSTRPGDLFELHHPTLQDALDVTRKAFRESIAMSLEKSS